MRGEGRERATTGMDPLANDRGPGGGFTGCLAALGAEGGDSESGAGSEEAMGCGDTFTSLPEMDKETLEEKLKGLAFRKQTSYR